MSIRPKHVKNFFETLILDLLNDKPMQSSGIIAEIHERHHVLLSPSILCPMLNELEEENLIKSNPGGSGRRRFYAITEKGKETLESSLKDMDKMRLISAEGEGSW